MKCLWGILSLSALAAVFVLGAGCHAPPNIVLIFTDDQGYADLSCQGAEGYQTPNLDRMARQGMRFRSFYVADAACTPSRAALLTGCYATRVGLPQVLFPRSKIGLNPDETTVAEVVKARGYATAAVGKWHLGHLPPFLPTNHGFDSWFGIPYSNDMSPDPKNNPAPRASRHPPLPLMRGTEVIEREPDQTTLVPRYTAEAVRFIRNHAGRQPFLLYFAHTFPHVPLYASPRFAGKTRRGLYGDVLEEIDWSVGQVLQELRAQGVLDNTLVIFTSDNGPWLVKGRNGGSAKPLREGKATTFEGGHRVPCIMHWPGHIPAGRVCDTMATTMDILPTVAAISGGRLPEKKIDGRNITALLEGKELAGADSHPFFYHRARNLQAVRLGRYKLHLPHRYASVDGAELATPTTPGRYKQRRIGLSLFDLETDVGESRNIADQHPELVKRLVALCTAMKQELMDGRKEGPGVRPPGRVGN